MKTDSMEVLYIEDDAADVDFAQMAFREVGGENIKLNVVMDGEQAVKSLGINGSSGVKNPVKPTLVLLDLNIPKVHGKELLKLIKKSDHLNKTPVVILSTSEYQKDIDETYRLGASGYFTKPADFDEYKEIFQAIYNYWGQKAKLPSKNGRVE